MVKEKTSSAEEPAASETAVDSDEKVEIAIDERPKIANLVVDKYAKWSFGVGFIPIPAVDLVALLGTQMKMLHEVAQVYGYSYSSNKIRSTVGALLSAALPQSATNASVGSFIKSIPIFGGLVGAFVMPTACAAATYALGIVFIKHFESGGTFLDVDLSVMKSQVKEIADKYRKNKEKEGVSVAS
jgi:uncharacterized protein (DUF697 family)